MSDEKRVGVAEIVAHYNGQTSQIMRGFGPSYKNVYDNIQAPVMFPQYGGDSASYLKHDTGVGTANDLDMFFVEGGLFADCCLGNPIMSLLCRPVQGVGQLLPVVGDNNELIKRGFLTGNYDIDGTRPDTVCEPGPNAGALDACFAEFRKGRISYSSRTAELDELIKNACIGINRNRFYIVGRNRGASGPIPRFAEADENNILRSALHREMHMIGNRMQMDLMQQLWTGDPANDTVGGGYKEFIGLLDQIVDDYGGGKSWISGTGDCALLNSDVKDFAACAGATNIHGYTLYQLMEEIQFELTQRARGYGVTVDWVIVMSSVHWQAITALLPCEMLSGQCSADALTDVTANVDAAALVATRNGMRNNFMIPLNGVNYPVLIDDFLPLTETIDGVTGEAAYTGDIIFLPLRVNGEPVLEWVHADYTAFNAVLDGLPVDTSELRGWSDDGRFHWVLQRDMRCFLLDVKHETSIIFTAPHLAGRITNVDACMAQAHKVLNELAVV